MPRIAPFDKALENSDLPDRSSSDANLDASFFFGIRLDYQGIPAINYGLIPLFSVTARTSDLRAKGSRSTVVFWLGVAALLSGCTTTGLHHEIQHGNHDRALALISEERGIEGRDARGYSALHVAIESGDVDIARALLEAGLSVNEKTYKGETALHILAKAHRPRKEILQLLLTRGAAPNSENSEGQTPLMVLCTRDSALVSEAQFLGIVSAFLEAGTDPNHADEDGLTALHYVSKYGQPTIVADVLLDHAADINARSLHGYSPLHVAARYHHATVAGHLLQAGAEIHLNDDFSEKIEGPWGEFEIRHQYEINAKAYTLAGIFEESLENDEIAAAQFGVAAEQFELAGIEYRLWSESFARLIKVARAENFRKTLLSIAITAGALASGVPMSYSPESSSKVDYLRTSTENYADRARICEFWTEELLERSAQLRPPAEDPNDG